MEVRPGFKPSEVGPIPTNWYTRPCSAISDLITVGIVVRPTQYYVTQGVPALRSANIGEDGINDHDLVFISEKSNTLLAKSQVRIGDVLTVRTGYPGTSAVVPSRFAGSNCIDILITRPSKEVNSHYLSAWINSSLGKYQVLRNQGGLAQQHFNVGDLRNLVVALPPTLAEQEAIAEALSDADRSIESLEQLLVKKRQLTQGAMQELLTGKKRLPGFGGEWTIKPIAGIAFPSSEKNVSGEHLPVLTCSKHLGFVDSLVYFKNQVFSRDTSGYKVVKRGQIGYPSNHVEEGSIGLQDLYDVALVSPIYVVFSVIEGVDSYFLHRLLKLDSYRQAFATATSSSVDRRGSLRWPAFSQIVVNLPRFDEQAAVVDALRDMEAETTALAGKLAKARQLKHGMMNELLTGKIRLV
jgi:type I restriction enzyme, S subunit